MMSANGSWVLLFLIIIASIPAVIVYVWFRIAKYPVSIFQFFLAMLIGAAGLFPALVLQNLMNFTIAAGGRLELFYHVFVRIAFTEELSRLLMLFIFFLTTGYLVSRETESSSQSIYFDPIRKGAAIGLVVGCGFAILESAVYAAADLNVLLLRAFTAAPLHAACGSRVGTAAAMFRTNPVQAILRLLYAAAIHGIYNLMISRPGISSIIAVLLAFSVLFSAVSTIRSGWNTEEKPSYNP